MPFKYSMIIPLKLMDYKDEWVKPLIEGTVPPEAMSIIGGYRQLGPTLRGTGKGRRFLAAISD